MDQSKFESELRRMADVNGIFVTHKRVDEIIDIVATCETDPNFVNIFRGSDQKHFLLVTDGASYQLRAKLFGTRADWIVFHDELVADVWPRRSVMAGYVVDEVVLEHQSGISAFRVGFNDPHGSAGASREVAEHNSQVAARDINTARDGRAAAAPRRRSIFDPEGPERAAGEAKDAVHQGDFLAAFARSVVAVDRLHDFYVFEGFRNREPSPRDAWIVDGLVSALCAAREHDRDADVREGVRTATYRLRTIAAAIERAGGNAVLYRNALDAIARFAADVDVSDIVWT